MSPFQPLSLENCTCASFRSHVSCTGGVTTKGICTTKGRWPYLNIKSGVTLDEINPTLSDQLIGYY